MFDVVLNSRPFNQPVELGLRTLFLLKEIVGAVSLERLLYYDYLMVHSADVNHDIPSLHADIPLRAGEWLVKRRLLEQGLELMFSKELVIKRFTDDGIGYSSSELTRAFLNLMSSEYANSLQERASWVIKSFGHYGEEELATYMDSKLRTWGTEFKNESLLRDLQ